jgi:thiosulfate reductase cytochrome b subunit
MAEQHHPVHRKKFNPTQATEGLGVVLVVLLGLAMLVGLLTASGKVGW